MNALASRFSGGKSIDDWLSPILVKELRQGMRARVFVISFLMLQVFLCVLVLANLAAQDDHETLEAQSHFFWVIVGFALLALMPLRGLVTVSQEVKNRTMETIMLTRLTAWRVVFGKWSALFAQSLLLVSAVLPYVVLRYFIGGDDVVSDFIWLIVLLWLSGILSAASIAISALGNVIIRIVILIGVIGVAGSGMGDFFSPGYSWGPPWEVAGWLLIFGFFVPALLFELTASSLAPASENHAVRRRVLAVAFALIAWGFAFVTKSDFKVGVIVPVMILVGVCYFELAEKPRVLPRMVSSFARGGWLGRIGAVFLLPGWPSALLFSFIVIPAAMAVFFLVVGADTNAGWLFPVLAVFGSVLVPIYITHTFISKTDQVLLMVVLYNIILLGVASVAEGFATLTHATADRFFAFFPSLPVLSVAMNVSQESFKDHVWWYFVGNWSVLSCVTLLLLWGSRRYFREVFAVLGSAEKAAALPSRPPEPAAR